MRPIRRGALAAALLALVFAASCQTALTLPTLVTLGNRYDELSRERARLIAANESASEAEARLAALATDAKTAAQNEADPKPAVAFWRIAALSAWQGGTAGHSALGSIVSAGEAACDRLAPPDFAAPGDCLLVRLAPIRTAYDEASTRVQQLEAKPRPLSHDDGDEIVKLFNGLESGFRRATALGERFATSSIEAGHLAALNEDRAEIFCLARMDLNLLTEVDGNNLGAITPFASRRDAMREALPDALRASPCS